MEKEPRCQVSQFQLRGKNVCRQCRARFLCANSKSYDHHYLSRGGRGRGRNTGGDAVQTTDLSEEGSCARTHAHCEYLFRPAVRGNLLGTLRGVASCECALLPTVEITGL